MHFPEQKLIFIHVPKTGGNYFSRCFLRFSEDRIFLQPGSHHDSRDRFEIRGPITRTKHQTLAAYWQALGERLGAYRVYAVKRPPAQRLLSLYFSPHRWMRRHEDGSFSLPPADEIAFDEARFAALLDEAPSLWQMLDAQNCTATDTTAASASFASATQIRHASGARIQLVDFADIPGAWSAFARRHGFDDPDDPGRPVNTSAAPSLKQNLLATERDRIEALISASHHARDRAFFEG